MDIFTFYNKEKNKLIIMKAFKTCLNLCGIALLSFWYNCQSKRNTWDRKPFGQVFD